METTQTQVEKPNFDTVWATLQEIAWRQEETDRQMKETARRQEAMQEAMEREAARRQEAMQEAMEREAARRQEAMQEAMEREAARRQEAMEEEAAWKKRHEELDRLVKANTRLIGRLGNRFGEMVEHMVVPNLLTKFRELGFVFEKAYQDTEIKDRKNNIFTEVDITLENGDKVMIVEVKSKPSVEDINEHIQRMEKVKTHAAFHGDKRKFLGAVAGMVTMSNVKEYTLKQGFYVIEPSGETFDITPPKGQPREW